MPHVKYIYRKSLNTLVQGVVRREWLLPSQELQRSNSVFSVFPSGETRATSCVVASSWGRLLPRRECAQQLATLVTSIYVFNMRHYTIAQDADGVWWGYQVEPNQSHLGWYENDVANSVRLGKGAQKLDWVSTLKRVE